MSGHHDDLHSARSIKSPISFAKFAKHQLQATVLDDLWLSLLFFGGWATMVVCLHEYTDRQVAVSSSLLGVLGTLIGFVVSLRTSSAYDRFWEGRRCWGILSLACRNLSTLIWLHARAGHAPEEQTPEEAEDEALKLLLEKRSALNLVVAFPFAVKHALRHEPGVYYEDLFPLIQTLPKYSQTCEDPTEEDVATIWATTHATTGSVVLPAYCQATEFGGRHSETPGRMSPVETMADESNKVPVQLVGGSLSSSTLNEKSAQSATTRAAPTRNASQPFHIELQPAFNPPKKTLYDHIPILYAIRPLVRFIFRMTRTPEEEHAAILKKQRRRRMAMETNIPLEISLFISSYISSLNERGMCDAMYTGQLLTAHNLMNDSYAALERILTTPLPYAYVVHLQIVVYLYLLLLPFQIVEPLGWITVPGLMISALFFLGFIVLGQQLEDPFGSDDGDLDLDNFCAIIAAEVAEIAAHPPHDPRALLSDPLNRPFASTGDNRTAQEILNARSADRLAEVRRGFAKHYAHELKSRVAANVSRAYLRTPRNKVEVYQHQQPSGVAGIV